MIMLRGLIILVFVVLVVVVDYSAIQNGQPNPSNWLQTGILAFILGIAATRTAADGLKRRHSETIGDLKPGGIGTPDRVILFLVLVAFLFLMFREPDLYSAFYGFVLGCVAHAVRRAPEIRRNNRQLRERPAPTADRRSDGSTHVD